MRSIDHSPSELDDRQHVVLSGILKVADKFSRHFFQPKLLLANALLAPLPSYVAKYFRARVLRAAGFDIGNYVAILGTPKIYGSGDIYKLLKIGNFSWINVGCHIDLNAPITIGERVGIGPEVMILTVTHEMGPEQERFGSPVALPVTIGDGVWIGARCTIKPGVTIGRGSVISTGTVVSRDVPPNTVVSGTQRMPFDKWALFNKNSNQAAPAGGGGS